MLVWLIPTVILIISVIIAVVIVRPHFNKIRLIDTETLPEAKSEAVKEKILKERLERAGLENLKRTKKILAPVILNIKELGRSIHGRIADLENHYQKLRRAEAQQNKKTSNKDQISELMIEAKELERGGALEEAEQKYIEIISMDQKNTEAYEELGHIYIELKKGEQARQTFEYILKIEPKDASVLTALGEIDMREQKFTDALNRFEQAIKLRPNNPKYLDFYIESAIMANDKVSAKKGIEQLAEVNPDNKKIEEFIQRVGQIKNNG